jgi:hypothetical protein
MVFKWRRRESNPQSPRFELGRFAFFAYRAVLLESALDGIWTRDLLRDRQASTPGCSTRACSHLSASGGSRTHSILRSKRGWSAGCLPSRLCPERESNPQTLATTAARRCPSRAALPRWRTWAKVAPDGVEPSFPGCGPGVVAVGPRGCSFQWRHRESHSDLQRAELASSCWTMPPEAEAVGLEPTSGHVAAACLPSRFLTSSDGFRNRRSPRRSGKRAALPLLPPLRTVRASFPAHGSSSSPQLSRSHQPAVAVPCLRLPFHMDQ